MGLKTHKKYQSCVEIILLEWREFSFQTTSVWHLESLDKILENSG